MTLPFDYSASVLHTTKIRCCINLFCKNWLIISSSSGCVWDISYCLILDNTCICWYSTCTCIMNIFKFRYTLVYILNRKYCTYTYVTFYYHLYALIIRIIIPDILIWTIRIFCLNYCFCIKLIDTLLKGYEANILDRWLGFVSVFLVLVLVMCNVKPLF